MKHEISYVEERAVGTNVLLATWATCACSWTSEREVVPDGAVVIGEATAAAAEKHTADLLGNTVARDGLDRCACGCKYWESDRCVDCGAHVRTVRREESGS